MRKFYKKKIIFDNLAGSQIKIKSENKSDEKIVFIFFCSNKRISGFIRAIIILTNRVNKMKEKENKGRKY